MSSGRKVKNLSDDKMKELKQNRLKKRTFAKVQWAVRAYHDWHNNCLSDPLTYDYRIYESDIDRLDRLGKENLEFALCKFIAEVTKVKDGSDYPGCTLYQMCVSIQKHLNQGGLNWKLVEGDEFRDLHVVLDNVMKERAAQSIGLVKRQAEYISFEYEDRLWNENILGEDTPDKLCDTVLFLLGMNLALRAGDEHYDLRCQSEVKPSQLSFKRNSEGECCLVYTEDTTTKTNDGGLKSMRKEWKVVWVYPSKNSVRDPVRLVEKYISLCPPVSVKTKKMNFYLHSLEKPTPTQWYGEQVVGLNSIRKVVGNLLKSAQLDGHFTNHSLRRSSTSRLFQSGVDRKLIKEFTGHQSDALNEYEITFDHQRKAISNIISGDESDKGKEKEGELCESKCETSNVEISIMNKAGGRYMSCSCSKRNIKIDEASKIAEVVKQIL